MVRVFQRETAQAIWGSESDVGEGATTFYHIDGVLQTFEAPDPSIEVEPKYYQNSFTPGILQQMRRTLEGRIEYIPYSGKLFEYALGKKTTTSETVNTLTIPDGSSEFPTMAWKVQYLQPVEFIRYFKGIYFGRMKWRIEGGGLFTADADIRGMIAPTSITKSTPTGTRRALVPAFTSTVEIGGITAQVLRAEIELNNNLDIKHYVEDAEGYPTAILQKRREITGRVSLNPSVSTLWDSLEDYTPVDLEITIARSTTDKCVLTASDGQIKSNPHPIPEEGPVETDVDLIFKNLEIELTGNFR